MRIIKITVILVFTAVFLVGCGGRGASTPEAAAQNWLNAFFKADGKTLRDTTCTAQSLALTDSVINGLSNTLGMTGATFDLSRLTYAYDATRKTVAIGGTVRITVNGITRDQDLTMLNLNILPVVEEGGGWKVCLNLLAM